MSGEEVIVRYPVLAKKFPGEVKVTNLRFHLQSSEPSKSLTIPIGSIIDHVGTQPDPTGQTPPLVRIVYHDERHKEKKLTVEMTHAESKWQHKESLVSILKDLRESPPPAVDATESSVPMTMEATDATSVENVEKLKEENDKRKAEMLRKKYFKSYEIRF